MRTFNITIDIDAPAERVWAVMSDTDRWHEWTPSITRIRRLGNAPFVIGTRVVSRQPKLPPALWTITEIEPGRSFTWVSTAPGLRVVAIHGVEPTETGSRATLVVEMHGLLAGLWGRLTQGITERYIALEAKGLARRSKDPGYRHGRS